MSDNIAAYDAVFVDSIIEEINEMLMEKYKDDETVPLLGIVDKEKLPGEYGIWLHVFKTKDVKDKFGV